MIPRRSQIDSPVLVVGFEEIMEAVNDMSILSQSAHLLSCGGMYLSPSPLPSPFRSSTHFISLPDHDRSILVLKNMHSLERPQTETHSVFEVETEVSPFQDFKKQF